MRRNRRLAVIAGLTATAITAATAAVVLTAPLASADVTGTPFVTTANSSDPHVINCTDPSTGTNGFCLYTSQDMGQQHAYPSNCLTDKNCANYYPMRDTLVYFSPTGYDNWTYKGLAFSEWQLDAWVPRRTDCTDATPPAENKPASGDTAGNCRAYHLWAPSATRVGNDYYLYVPDVSNTNNTGTPNIHTSSRIAVAKSIGSPFGLFIYQGTVDFSSGYMSDPDIVVDGSNRYLVWADGDKDTCGGFKSAKLNSDMQTITPGTTQTLTINGVEVLGECTPAGGSTDVNRPYMEGASLYKRSFAPGKPWTLFFAVKPDDSDIDGNRDGKADVPEECNSINTPPGSANTHNEAIAWASATNPQGPFTYEGIVMCGSTSEWTNQATITVASNNRLIIIYHDSAPDVKQRKLHAECLFVAPGIIGGVYRQNLAAAHGFNRCNGIGVSSDVNYEGLWGYDPQNPDLPTIISSNNTGGDLKAMRYWVGARERYRFVSLGSNTYAIQSLADGMFVCTPDSSTRLRANCTTSLSTGAQFAMEILPTTGRFRLRKAGGNYLSISTSGWLYASGLDTASAAEFARLSPIP